MNDLHYTDSWMIYNYIILTLKCFTLFVHHLTTLVRIMHLQIQSSPCVFDQRRASWKLTREEISAIKLPSLSWLTWFLGNFPCACFHLHCFPSVDQTTKERNMWTCQWSGKPVELCVHVQQSQLATLKVWNWNKSITVSCGIWAGALLTLCIAEQHQDGSRSDCLSDALICPLFSVIHANYKGEIVLLGICTIIRVRYYFLTVIQCVQACRQLWRSSCQGFVLWSAKYKSYSLCSLAHTAVIRRFCY